MPRMPARIAAIALCLGALALTGCTDGNGNPLFPASTGFGGSGSSLQIALNANPSSRYVSAGQSVTLSVSASGGSGLSYSWSATGGSLSSSSSNPVVWTAPSSAGDYVVQVSVGNGSDEASGAIRFTVQ